MPALVGQEGQLAGSRFEVSGELVIGRENCDVTIDAPAVSRRHASVRQLGDGLEVTDLGSTNGTFVNGARVSAPTPLAEGDVLRIGSVSFHGETDATVVASAAPVTEDPGATVLEAPAIVEPTVAPEPPAAPEPPPAPTPAPEPVAPVAAAQPLAAVAPPVPFNAGQRKRGSVATRQLAPAIVAIGVVVADAAALVVYFALR